MTTPSRVSSEVGYWRGVTEWCLGENNSFGTCAFAAIGNLHALVTTLAGHPEVMSNGEIELMDHNVTGFMPTDRGTDRGAALEDVLRYWYDHGWAGDPTLKPVGWKAIEMGAIAETIDRFGAAYCWFMLPSRDDQWDLSDGAVAAGIDGTGAHCMLIVGAGPGRFWCVTWGEVREVTADWMAAYFRGGFAVQHPLWVRPA